jgi:hypothetical protein
MFSYNRTLAKERPSCAPPCWCTVCLSVALRLQDDHKVCCKLMLTSPRDLRSLTPSLSHFLFVLFNQNLTKIVMGLHAPRQVGTCPAGSNFYSCNGFRVCCTIDPCNPGQTCPKDKIRGGDATSASQEAPKSTPSKTSAATLLTITSRTSLASTTKSVPKSTDPSTLSFVISMTPTSTLSFVISMTPTSTPSSSEQPQPSRSTSPNTSQNGGSTTPIAPIVGGIVGAVVLIAMCAIVWACLKRRRRKSKIYQAPIYPSPDIGNDMSSQLDLTHETKRRSSWHGIQQLDSTEVTSHRVLPVELPRGFAELPAEPAVR